MAVPSGALRFNSDSRKLEYYNGEAWWQIDSFTPDSATGGARGVFMQGRPTPANNSNIIDYVTISTTGNAIDFGDLSRSTLGGTALSSSTRGLSATGYDGVSEKNTIEYITIASTGNAQDFGDLTNNIVYSGSTSSSTRGLFVNGMLIISPASYSNIIHYVTIASTGDAQDFGDTTQARRSSNNGISNGTRAVFGGGGLEVVAPTVDPTNIIDYVIISTLGNAADFGDLLSATQNISSCSNATRGIFAGGGTPGVINVIQYITISTLGNSQDFGDLTGNRFFFAASCASPTRGVFGGGNTSPARVNIIDYVTIMSTGNAVDFGDLTVDRDGGAACSNGHGGL